MQDIQYIQENIGYEFKDIALLKEALTHKSYGYPNNERMEFLGDRLIAVRIADGLYDEPSHLNVPTMAQLHSNIVSHQGLLTVARRINLKEYLRIAEVNAPHFSKEYALSDAVESIAGAIFKDSHSINAATQFIVNCIPEMDLRRDPKSTLQEFTQSYEKRPPKYDARPLPDGTFHATVECLLLGLSANGYGRNRKEAEMNAARSMLRILGHKGR